MWNPSPRSLLNRRDWAGGDSCIHNSYNSTAWQSNKSINKWVILLTVTTSQIHPLYNESNHLRYHRQLLWTRQGSQCSTNWKSLYAFQLLTRRFSARWWTPKLRPGLQRQFERRTWTWVSLVRLFFCYADTRSTYMAFQWPSWKTNTECIRRK